MACDLIELLKSKPYPGRGIVIGKSADGDKTYVLYFIMGRSENSRNRIFTETEDGIKTEAFDPAKLSDPSLIIYHPVRFYNGAMIVTNGDQTDTIWEGLKTGSDFRASLNTREFEPDKPNYTPRISGIVDADGSYKLSILKSFEGDPACCCRYYFEYDKPVAGFGHFISTYRGDGDPIPSFPGEPVVVNITGEIEDFAKEVWTALNCDNKVSLYACEFTNGADNVRQFIYNKNQGE